eukprot:gene24547-29860_t
MAGCDLVFSNYEPTHPVPHSLLVSTASIARWESKLERCTAQSHNFLRQTIVPVAANTIGGVVLFETFEELLRRQ